jgi:hypothetical protein
VGQDPLPQWRATLGPAWPGEGTGVTIGMPIGLRVARLD